MPKTPASKTPKASKVFVAGIPEVLDALRALRAEQQQVLRAVLASGKEGHDAAAWNAIQQAIGALDLAPGQLEAVLAVLRTHVAPA